MRREKGFIRGIVVPFLAFSLVVYLLFMGNINVSFTFSGRDKFVPFWERLSDKTIQVVKAIF